MGLSSVPVLAPVKVHESLLSRCFVTKLERPSQQPHFGSVVERLFGTTTTELLNQLLGNTHPGQQNSTDDDPRG